MKITGIYTFSGSSISPVDRWRLKLPFEELKKQTDWDVELRNQFIIGESEEIAADEIKRSVDLFQDTDLVWSSYYSNKMQYAFVKTVEAHTPCKFVLDVDDDIYEVPKHNPFWLMMNEDLVDGMQRMVETAEYVVTTNERLAAKLRDKRAGYPADRTIVVPNYISRRLHTHPKFDNGDKVKIGYFGGASHYADLNKTNFATALNRIMHDHKNVEFELYGWWGKNKRKETIVGSFIDANLPTQRTHLHKGARGEEWYKLFKTINLDIAVGPLVDDNFNQAKSDIKWQEASMMGAAFVASNTGPYRGTIRDGVDGLLVKNTVQDWYEALESLMRDDKKRKDMAKEAKRRVLADFTIEKNWEHYKEVIEGIVNG